MSGKHEREIETVLNALQHVEPDGAMQGRILSALQAAEAAQRPLARAYRWSNPAFSVASVAWLATAAVLLAAGGMLLLHREGSRGTQQNQAVSTKPGKIPGFSQVHRSPASTGQRSTVPFNSTEPERVPYVLQRHGIRLQTVAKAHVSEARRGHPLVCRTAAAFQRHPSRLPSRNDCCCFWSGMSRRHNWHNSRLLREMQTFTAKRTGLLNSLCLRR